MNATRPQHPPTPTTHIHTLPRPTDAPPETRWEHLGAPEQAHTHTHTHTHTHVLPYIAVRQGSIHDLLCVDLQDLHGLTGARVFGLHCKLSDQVFDELRTV